jgi:hypothetical protein
VQLFKRNTDALGGSEEVRGDIVDALVETVAPYTGEEKIRPLMR